MAMKKYINLIAILCVSIVVSSTAQTKPSSQSSPAVKSGRKHSRSKHSPPRTLYEKVAANAARDPDFLKRLNAPPKEMEQVRWLVGVWEISGRAFATRTTPERAGASGQSVAQIVMNGRWLSYVDSYPDSTEQTFLGYDPFTKEWVSQSIGSSGYAFTARTSDDWRDGRLVFTSVVDIFGIKTRLRQTMEKRSDREYRLLNEERLPDGEWVAVDEYVYRKISDIREK
jgi:hypothetical protein